MKICDWLSSLLYYDIIIKVRRVVFSMLNGIIFIIIQCDSYCQHLSHFKDLLMNMKRFGA